MRRTALACLLAMSAPTSYAAPPLARLAHAEALVPARDATEPQAYAAQLRADDAGRDALRFRAFGRDFAFALRNNPRLARKGADYLVQEGTLPSAPGSWVRITRRGSDIIGMFSDGEELFAIEPAAGLVALLAPGTPAPAAHNLVYRLADLRIDPAALACGLDGSGGPETAAAAVAALGAELGESLAAVAGPLRRVTLAPVADVEFASRYGVNAETEIMARLNTVDGIFREQVGIDLAVGVPDIIRSEAEPYFFKSNSSNELLGQVSDYREQTGQYRNFGLTHLFTNKRLEGNLAGIAWLGAACAVREGAALSSSNGLTVITSALVTAHEIGHNFGARHDGEAGAGCESTPQVYLMAPRVASGPDGSTFSACSLERINALIGGFACLTALAGRDVALLSPGDVQGNPGEPTAFTLTVRNIGAEDVSGLDLQVEVPEALAITTLDPGQGSCNTRPGGMSCQLDQLPAEATWAVAIEVQSTEVQRYTVNARAAAAGDESAGNDATAFSVTIGNPQPAATSGGGGGGSGGALLLAILAIATYRRPRRVTP
jgi:hypothetical protein